MVEETNGGASIYARGFPTMLDEQLTHALRVREAEGRRRRLLLSDAAEAERLARLVDFSSNDYVSVARNPRVRRAWLERLGASDEAFGSTGSRLLDGDSTTHTQLEHKLAAYFHAPAALLCNTGFDANVSLLSTIPQPGDAIVYDELVHASMHDGMRKSRAQTCVAFRHNDPVDLDRVLANLRPHNNVFLALESVYSMDGTICALPDLIKVLEQHVPHRSSRHILVDEAHGAGVYGQGGRGVCNALHCHVSARLVTFGKAFGCGGAVLLVPVLWREYLLNYARPLIYSTALPPSQAAAIDVVISAWERGEMEAAVQMLHTRVAELYTALGLRSDAALPPAPIVQVRSAHAKRLAAHVQAAGFLVRAVCYPTVPRDKERVRVCVHAHNTAEDVARLAHVLRTLSLL